jgi:hypothetical protein
VGVLEAEPGKDFFRVEIIGMVASGESFRAERLKSKVDDRGRSFGSETAAPKFWAQVKA